jgi:hypothetical protein
MQEACIEVERIGEEIDEGALLAVCVCSFTLCGYVSLGLNCFCCNLLNGIFVRMSEGTALGRTEVHMGLRVLKKGSCVIKLIFWCILTHFGLQKRFFSHIKCPLRRLNQLLIEISFQQSQNLDSFCIQRLSKRRNLSIHGGHVWLRRVFTHTETKLYFLTTNKQQAEQKKVRHPAVSLWIAQLTLKVSLSFSRSFVCNTFFGWEDREKERESNVIRWAMCLGCYLSKIIYGQILQEIWDVDVF